MSQAQTPSLVSDDSQPVGMSDEEELRRFMTTEDAEFVKAIAESQGFGEVSDSNRTDFSEPFESASELGLSD